MRKRKRKLTALELETKAWFAGEVHAGRLVCEVCSMPGLLHAHRVLPGLHGGRYEPLNISPLCPTHHAAVHFMMKWFFRDKACKNRGEELLVAYLRADPNFWSFWQECIWPECMERLTGKRPTVRSEEERRMLANVEPVE